MSKNRNTKGITLIALIITIIILLILAGVSIVSITAENGILNKAKVAKEEDIKAKQEEILKLIGTELRPDKILNHLTTKEFMDLYQEKIQEEIKKEEILKEANVERRNEETIYVITKENNVYKITENEIKYIGKIGEDPPPDLQQTDIDFKIIPNNGYTNTYAEIEIVLKIEIGENILQYSTDGKTWENYTQKIIMQENGSLYARLINEIGEIGESATQIINIIDKQLPNEAIISFQNTTIEVQSNMTATITQSDRGISGVEITKCRWIYTTSNQAIGTEESQYSEGGIFKKTTEDITQKITIPGTYYLHVLTVDKAGNKKETISVGVNVMPKEFVYLNVPITDGSYAVGSTPGWSRANWNEYLYRNSFSSHGSRVATLTSDSTFDMNGIQTVTFTCGGGYNYTTTRDTIAYIKMEVYEAGGDTCSNQVQWTSINVATGPITFDVDVSKLTKPSYIRLSVWSTSSTSQGWGAHVKVPMKITGK